MKFLIIQKINLNLIPSTQPLTRIPKKLTSNSSKDNYCLRIIAEQEIIVQAQ